MFRLNSASRARASGEGGGRGEGWGLNVNGGGGFTLDGKNEQIVNGIWNTK